MKPFRPFLMLFLGCSASASLAADPPAVVGADEARRLAVAYVEKGFKYAGVHLVKYREAECGVAVRRIDVSNGLPIEKLHKEWLVTFHHKKANSYFALAVDDEGECTQLVGSSDEVASLGRRSDQEALKPFGPLVGAWRGVGQPQRGSNKGAWTESGDWKWKLTKDSAALELTIAKGKYLKSAALKPDKEPGRFVLEATLADGSKRAFRGKAGDRDVLALTADKDDADGPARVTLTPLHDTRFLLLLEARDGESFRRLAEVGYTRKGVAFAAGDSSPPCIVTDGKGTIPVKHMGTTYYVCCSGCKELFEADPDAVIAEAQARHKEAKAK